MKSPTDFPDFEAFVIKAEPRLRRALTAGFGAAEGRDATRDALSWGWENWARVKRMRNPVGYLYRVGATSAVRGRPSAREHAEPIVVDDAVGFEPSLIPALQSLSEQQRTAVVLVHGYGYTFREAADVLGVSLSTLRNHVKRALLRLRSELEVEHEYVD